MKKHIVSSLFLGLTLLLAAVRLSAHEGGHETKRPAPPPLPEAVPEIVAALDSQRQSLGMAVRDGKLDRVAPHARTINLLVRQLAAKASDHHQDKLKELAAQHEKLTAELIKASASGSMPETVAGVEKINASISALKAEAH